VPNIGPVLSKIGLCVWWLYG